MPKRSDISSVLVIGSGPIVIGQAAEFDYSGTQACRVLQEEGIRVILINSNPATIMTDPGFADATYIEPITAEVIEKIIQKEKPDAILPTLGGQTALNAAMEIHDQGLLEKYGVELIGANVDAIRAGEDRQTFKDLVLKLGGDVARSKIAHSMEEALDTVEEFGYPMVVRPSFTMGGLGSGIAFNEQDLYRIAGGGLDASPTNEVLLEESILGWKEYELELMRDKNDNVVVVCSIENVDPVGVHTGDSITVAPALTLTDREYQNLRNLSIAVIRAVGVDTGGCNIQFAVDPDTGRVIIIEMNPRVSRSSALASKATGYPIAKIAAKLAIGYTLDEIENDITKVTPASFEPTLDYVVVKAPRFAFEKFPAADATLTTTMKSVGEAMAIGRTFGQALQKALRSLEKKGSEFSYISGKNSLDELLKMIETPTEWRINQVQQALLLGAGIEQIYEITKIDRWFLYQIQNLIDEAKVFADAELTEESLIRAKRHGFSDSQLAEIKGLEEQVIRESRHNFDIRPVYKTVDTCAGEFPALTPYHYSSYESTTEVVASDAQKVLIIGSGPNRIGQGIEFDYSCVHASFSLSESGFETIMVNCNPETVSTDYDTSDRLYFEPLTLEDVLEIVHAESQSGEFVGAIVQLGGQTALGLAQGLKANGVPILGTSPDQIDAAEERGKFSEILQSANLRAPDNDVAYDNQGAFEVAKGIGFPVLVRPSFVLGGRGMEIIYDEQGMSSYFDRNKDNVLIDKQHPLLVDRFLDDAIEIDVDALYDGEQLFIGGIMEHIEEAGIHSGDSSCTLPPVTLSDGIVAEVRKATEDIASSIGVKGLINIQFALSAGGLFVLEANPRASRTVPFVSKALGITLAKAASLIMVGYKIQDLINSGNLPAIDGSHAADSPISVKEAVLPFRRFTTPEGKFVDSLLGPEMRSTGEVMGIAADFPTAFAKSQVAAGVKLPKTGRVFVSVSDRDKNQIVLPIRRLWQMGFEILATSGTARILGKQGIPAMEVTKFSEKAAGETSIVEMIAAGEVDIVINTPSGGSARADGYEIRAATTASGKAIFTTTAQLAPAIASLEFIREHSFEVQSLQEYDRQRVR
ncbi:MAG: carbamoyl-phosphate synthase large subunit [Microbacteriaceae bacterium]|nr:carbamoyl-phosphate synthase large subunit [Microbacteriaceae bacterium]